MQIHFQDVYAIKDMISRVPAAQNMSYTRIATELQVQKTKT